MYYAAVVFPLCAYFHLPFQMKVAAQSISANVKPSDLHEDDLAMEIEDEYDPMIPNSYEQVLKERRAEREKIREEEVCL